MLNENSQSAFRVLSPKLNLDTVLCVKLARSVDVGGVFSFYNRHFKVLTSNNLPAIPQKAKINVLVGPRISIKVQYKNTTFDTLYYLKPIKKCFLPLQTIPSQRRSIVYNGTELAVRNNLIALYLSNSRLLLAKIKSDVFIR